MTGAILGAGYFAGIQAEAWRRVPGVRIAAVADPLPGKARAFADRWGVPAAFDSAEALLAGTAVDFVDIATRPDTHRPLTELAAAAGKHVICQKPLADTWTDGVAMVAACERAGVRLLVHENWRWQPWYRAVKRLVEAGAVGRPFQLSFRLRTGDGRGPDPYPVQPYFRDMPRLLVHETLVHFLDTFRFLAGEPDWVFCRLGRLNPTIRGEDAAVVHLGFPGGVGGLIDANRISGPVPPETTMGTFTLEGDAGQLAVSPDGRVWVNRHGEPPVEHLLPPCGDGYKGDSVFATQAHLADCLRAGRPSESDGRDYLATVRLVFACYESARSNRVVALADFSPTDEGGTG
jgi:predicted dehydrogenase